MFLMSVGNGTLKGHPTLPEDIVMIPGEFLLSPTTVENALSELVDWCFPELNAPNIDFASENNAYLTIQYSWTVT